MGHLLCLGQSALLKKRREREAKDAAKKSKTDETTRWKDWDERLLPVATKTVTVALEEYGKRVAREMLVEMLAAEVRKELRPLAKEELGAELRTEMKKQN